jgi:sporulation protein YqfC
MCTMDKIKKALAQAIDLPEELFLKYPRFTMVGQIQFMIENHKGIIQFTEHFLELELFNGQLTVHGKEFTIRYVTESELLLEGKIQRIDFEVNEK